jgi:hypothetical protein
MIQMSERQATVCTHGIQLVYRSKNSNQIIAAVFNTVAYQLGQQVYSKGEMFSVETGTPGIIVGIHEPHKGDRMTDILDVYFVGQREALRMKFTDLKLTDPH